MKESTKKRKAIIGAAILLCAVICAGVIWMMFGSNEAVKFKEITQIDQLNLRLSGMRMSEEYEIICTGESAEISRYYLQYGDGEETRELQSRTTCNTRELLDILNECQVGKWNGFHGKHPRNVTDGTMFQLTATVNGGQTLYADGSQNFPKHYHDFEQWLYQMCDD